MTQGYTPVYTGGMKYKKTIVSLPETIADSLQKFADLASEGNKSRFTAEALQEKMDRMRKLVHTARIRESYRAAAKRNQELLKEWQHVDAETARQLDEQELSTER